MNFIEYLKSNKSSAVLFDGAMGTSLQLLNLSSEDFGGEHLDGCNENLIRTSPQSIEKVHRSFLEAGADVIETNTFGATSIVLSEYDLQDYSYEINLESAKLAKRIAKDYSDSTKQRYVAGSIGPTTKLPTLGHINFDLLRSSYQDQVEALVEGGVDLLILETCQDVLQIKAALLAIKSSLLALNRKIPIMVSITMETTGTMLVGSDISSVLTILEPYEIDILGLNCATGPEQMKEHIKYLSQYSPFITSCIPNAGLPENVGGKAHYKLTPIELKIQLMHFIKDLGVKVIGGCCGTTPAHISQLSTLIREIDCIEDLNKDNKKVLEPAASSIYETTTYKQDLSFLIIGERLNASGSKKVRNLLNEEDWDGLVSIAKDQQKENAHILDVNVDYVGRDGIKDMHNIVSRLVTNINLPLMLDSTDAEKMESGLKRCGGKCILNSTNFEDGPERFYKILNLAKDFGAAVVIGTIDEEGMARTRERKFSISKRSIEAAIEYGIKESDIFIDPLVLPISTGIEEDRSNAKETIESIKQIHAKYPLINLVLGISNVSFGLSPIARATLNSVFLNECLSVGLSAAIVSPSKILPLSKIDKSHINVCLDLIYDKRIINDSICTYDPLTELTTQFVDKKLTIEKNNLSSSSLPVEERLKTHIIDGEKQSLEENLNKALEKYTALEIINRFLLEGMKVVGELFGSGQMQLPFVLQSAETMKYAVSILEPHIEDNTSEANTKPTFLIATVKGDVHDIGKNLVDIILTNNGYRVINLGIKQDVSSIINAYKKYQPDCIAMSGLLVKSTAFMKDNLISLNEANISVPVILGGAALTPKFVNQDCNSIYNGLVIYGKDAFTDLKFMDYYIQAKKLNNWNNKHGFINTIPDEMKKVIPSSTNDLHQKSKKTLISNYNSDDNNSRSTFINLEKTIDPPFIGTEVITSDQINLKELFYYLDKNALFSSQWQFKRNKKQSQSEYKRFLMEKAEPILDDLYKLINVNKLINPSFVYGYFPCGRVGNTLKIYSPENKQVNIGSFTFPRQRSGNRLCISDFFNDLVDSEPSDFIPMQAVTMGEVASKYAQQLFREDKYSEYLFFHGLTVQLAEALAEYSHALIRNKAGFHSSEPNNVRGVLAQKYRGCRYSFGYPACPNVRDSKLQLEWLQAERIGLTIDESDQLHPEQSTTAIISLHTQAKYFSA